MIYFADELERKLNNENYSVLSDFDTVRKDKILIRNNNCGHIFSSYFMYVKVNKNHCPICNKNKKILVNEKINDEIRNKCPNNYTLYKGFNQNEKSVLIKHELCGVVFKVYFHLTRIDEINISCPYCNQTKNNQRYLLENPDLLYKHLLKLFNDKFELLTPISELKKSYFVKIMCKNCNNIKALDVSNAIQKRTEITCKNCLKNKKLKDKYLNLLTLIPPEFELLTSVEGFISNQKYLSIRGKKCGHIFNVSMYLILKRRIKTCNVCNAEIKKEEKQQKLIKPKIEQSKKETITNALNKNNSIRKSSKKKPKNNSNNRKMKTKNLSYLTTIKHNIALEEEKYIRSKLNICKARFKYFNIDKKTVNKYYYNQLLYRDNNILRRINLNYHKKLIKDVINKNNNYNLILNVDEINSLLHLLYFNLKIVHKPCGNILEIKGVDILSNGLECSNCALKKEA